jgi:transaldolase/glucose-6-phosphate isomerase
MAGNPLKELNEQGQSVWLDYVRRGLITSGELRQMIDEDAISGLTSNPTIFEKAIGGSSDYDAAMRRLVPTGRDPYQLFEAMAIEDIQAVADLLRPIYDGTGGADGFASLELPPSVANDTGRSIEEARRLWRELSRPNVMIKVPGTAAGIPAIEALIGEGVNVNVTLLFDVDNYAEVANAYIAGLERLAARGAELSRAASVASFFVSRVDTAVDKQLEEKIKASAPASGYPPAEQERLRGLLGKAAIANAKIAYQRFQEIFGAERFARLKAKGARVQRPLWASTSTKNPAYRDVMYVEELIGPDTVDTMPPATIAAFRDHGRVARTVDRHVEASRRVWRELAEVGIDLHDVTAQLQVDGVKLFADSFDKLIETVAQKRDAIMSGYRHTQSASLGVYQAAVDRRLARLREEGFCRRLFAKDASLWTEDPEVQASIKGALGWLDVIDLMQEHVGAVEAFADAIRPPAFQDAVLLGMGGSSLAPEVCRVTFGPQPGRPRMHVLDGTHPDTVRALRQAIDPARTLFIVSSKSGTTTETLDFFHYFWVEVERAQTGAGSQVSGAGGDEVPSGTRHPTPSTSVGQHFVAITDAGTPLEALARERGFRHVFINPSDIGGRYSALSYFGLVPAAIQGLDVATLLDIAERVGQSCTPSVPYDENSGLWLGAILGELALAGRDKLTLIASPELASFGLWVEQLIAESTGKQGKGILPVAGEPVGRPEVYGSDRVFVYVHLESGEENAPPSELEGQVRALEAAGQPVVRLTLLDRYDVGGEFFRWELAVATAGALIGINPFDQPNVQESKDITKRLLGEWERTGRLPTAEPIVEQDGVALYGGGAGGGSVAGALRDFAQQAGAGSYVALLAYLDPTEAGEARLTRLRTWIRDRRRVATTAGWGPRYLHSTGQLHKGGPPTGRYVVFTDDPSGDLPVPGERYGFATLVRAQALGDQQALEAHGRPVVRVHLGRDSLAALDRLVGEITG